MSSTHHPHHPHPHFIPPPFPYNIGSGGGGAGGGGGSGGGGRPSPINTISTPTSAGTLYTSPEDSTIVIPKTEHDEYDDEESSSRGSHKGTTRHPRKKQKRNKPTLSCQECVERKTKVSSDLNWFCFFLFRFFPASCCHFRIVGLPSIFASCIVAAGRDSKRTSVYPDRHGIPLDDTSQNKFATLFSCFHL